MGNLLFPHSTDFRSSLLSRHLLLIRKCEIMRMCACLKGEDSMICALEWVRLDYIVEDIGFFSHPYFRLTMSADLGRSDRD